ncbi:uncharacterized protein LOC135827122 [Sycon ciliatum]|uniref:uncharacterized protein LOC135827122 n=1 Tax=Sycon ciliatum TaxID=27933 RepID=UPI0031F683F1
MPSADPYPWASLRPDNKTIFPVLFPVVYCDVPAIANGTADKTSVKFTHSVTYSCDEKHVLMGSSTARCQADGTLTSVPFCEALPPTTIPTTTPATTARKNLGNTAGRPTTRGDSSAESDSGPSDPETKSHTPTEENNGTQSHNVKTKAAIAASPVDETGASDDKSTSGKNSNAKPVSGTTLQGEGLPTSNSGSTNPDKKWNTPTGKGNGAQSQSVSTNAPIATSPQEKTETSGVKNTSRHNSNATRMPSPKTEGEGPAALYSGSSNPENKRDTPMTKIKSLNSQGVAFPSIALNPQDKTGSSVDKSTSRYNTNGAPVSSIPPEIKSDAPINKTNSTKNQSVALIVPMALNPHDENDTLDDESANGDNSNVSFAALTTSKSSARFITESSRRKGANGDGNGDDDNDSIVLLFSPLIFAGCAVLAFIGFMVRRNRLRREEAYKMELENFEDAFQNPKNLDEMNKAEEADQTQDQEQPKSELADEHITAPQSDRSSTSNPHAQEVPHIQVGQLPVFLPEDVSVMEQDIDALAHMLGSPLPPRLAQSHSTGSAYGSQWSVADELQLSGRDHGCALPISSTGMSVSQPSAAEIGKRLHLEQHGASGHKSQPQCFSVADLTQALAHRAGTHQGLHTLPVKQRMLGSRGLSKSNSNASVHSAHTFVADSMQDTVAGYLKGAVSSIARGDSFRSTASFNSPTTTLNQSQDLAPNSYQTFTVDAISQTESFYDDVMADEVPRSPSKKKKKGSKKQSAHAATGLDQALEPRGNVEPSFSADTVGYDEVECQASMSSYGTVTRTAGFDRPRMSRASGIERRQSELVGQVDKRGEAQVALSLPVQSDLVTEIDDKEYEPLTPYQLAAAAAASASREKSAQRAQATLSRGLK